MLSKKWQVTLQVGEVRIIVIRPARHTVADFYLQFKICFLPIVFRRPVQKPNKEPKVEERFPSARIFANLHVARRILSPAVKMEVQ